MPLSVPETDVFDYLSIANRTELQGSFIVFLNAVESIHQAVVVDTMSDAEHMSNLVNHGSKRRVKDLIPVDFGTFP